MLRLSRRSLVVIPILFSPMVAIAAGNGVVANSGDKGSLNAFQPRVIPVLVQVNSQGDVTRVDPAYRLTPRFSRLLDRNVAEMISEPALDKQGRPAPSTFVLNLAVATNALADGRHEAAFRYVSVQPVPQGQWGWEHVDGHCLALFDRNNPGGQRSMPLRDTERHAPKPWQDNVPTLRDPSPAASSQVLPAVRSDS